MIIASALKILSCQHLKMLDDVMDSLPKNVLLLSPQGYTQDNTDIFSQEYGINFT